MSLHVAVSRCTAGIKLLRICVHLLHENTADNLDEVFFIWLFSLFNQFTDGHVIVGGNVYCTHFDFFVYNLISVVYVSTTLITAAWLFFFFLRQALVPDNLFCNNFTNVYVLQHADDVSRHNTVCWNPDKSIVQLADLL